MATLLDAPIAPSPAKIDEFVHKQIGAARRRLRLLDCFMAGLSLAIGSLVFLLVVLLIDRYVETPRGTGWGVLAVYLGLAAGFVYLALFRRSRRQINPYYAARQVEQTVPNAKNSLVTWVDFEEDQQLPGSIRTAIGQKAARDLKGVDLNRAIENRKILWLGIIAAAFALANLVVAFLPPTRTELTIEEPKNGDITVFNNQEVAFRVHVAGRIPSANAPDAVRLRMWYNPDDPETYEERPMSPIEGEKRKFGLIIPAKQVRFGFRYKILAGKTATAEHTVTCKIIPEFTGFGVTYDYPAYLNRAPESSNDANLLAPYGTVATIVVLTNREVKRGHIEIEGQARTIDGQVLEDRPDAIQFTLPMEREGAYRIHFTTPEGDKNQDPARLRIGVIDPKPVIRTFDIDYDYPAYLRFKPMSAKDVREPEIEAPRGSKVVVTAKTTRGVESATLEYAGMTFTGEKVPDQPMWTRFKLPALDKDGPAKVSFKPTTSEATTAPRSIPVRVLTDQAPTVQIDEPKEAEKQLPANGTLELKGLATDDHGVDRLTLRMVVKTSGEDRYLKPKPYRGGMSFLRKEDNSWPTRVEYKDFIKLPDLRLEKDPNWRAAPGAVIEYWLEAVDNCAVPEPNRNVSEPKKRIIVIAPVMKPEEQKKIDQQNRKADQDQRKHEKQQDNTNANEKRDAAQPPPPGAEKPKDQGTEKVEPKEPGREGDPQRGMNPGMPPEGDPNHAQQTQDIENAIKRAEQDKKPGDIKPDQRATPDAKVDPNEQRPQPKMGPMQGPPPAEDRTPKTDPNMDMMGGDGPAGAARPGNVDKTPEDKGETKPSTEPKTGMPPEKGGDKPSAANFGGGDKATGAAKPEPKEPMPRMPGMPPENSVEKGTARKEPGKTDPKDPANADKRDPGAAKPDKEVTSASQKPAGDPGPMSEPTPPSDAGTTKPRETPSAGGTKPEPKKDEVTDAGAPRKGPMDEDAGSGAKPSKPDMNEQARGGNKPGPESQPPPGGNEQGDLEREMGELEREINSTKPEIDPKKQATADRLIRNRETREQMRQKFDQMEKDAGNDELKKKKTQEMRAAAEKAANEYDKEKPTPENIEKASQGLNSKDQQTRKDAENRIKDWENNAQTRDELKKNTDELKKKDRNAGEKVEDAMKKAEQARNQGGNEQTPKVDEKQLSDIAKNLNGMDEKAKADAQKKLEKMMQDPKTRQDAKDKLEQMANNATDPKEKQDLENAAKQADQMADQFAKKDPPQPKDGKIDPKALEDAAKKLASGDPKAQQDAKDQLKEMMKDPKAAKEAQDKLKEMAKNAKTPEEKQALENAAKQAEQIAKDMGPKEGPKPKPDDLKDIAKKMAGNDPQAKKDAEDKLKEMMKDPKNREEAMKMLNDLAKNMKDTPEDQKALDEAMKKADEMAKNQDSKMDPKDLDQLAKEFDKMDPKDKEELKKKFDEMMKDPKKREEMKKRAEEMAKNATPEQKKRLDDMMRQMAGGEYLDQGKPDPADPRNKLKAAELVLEKFKKDEKKLTGELGWTEEQKAKWIKDQEAAIEALRKQVEKGDWTTDRNRRTPNDGIVKPEFNPKDGTDGSRTGRYAPPSGYIDPYKKLTTGGASQPKK